MKFIERAFKKKKERGHPLLYVFIDLHETVITPTYNNNNEGAQFYPGAIEVLQQWSKNPNVQLILWSSSHQYAAQSQLDMMRRNHGIIFDHFNQNPNELSTAMCDFSRKPYMDILIDDKANWNAEKDWLTLKRKLIKLGEWQ